MMSIIIEAVKGRIHMHESDNINSNSNTEGRKFNK